MASNPTNMDPEEFEQFLYKHGITETKRKGSEVFFPCPFGGCDDDRRPGEEYHMSFSCSSCIYNCFKCGEKGNFITLLQHYGDYDNYCNEQKAKRSQSATKARKPQSLDTVVKRIHEKSREHIRDYYASRGINSDSIDKFMLGAGDLTGRLGYIIPVFNKLGKVAYVKIRRAAEDDVSEVLANQMKQKAIPKYTVYPTGSELILVGEDQLLKNNSSDVLICEGELDRIIAIQEGVKMPVVTSGGAQTFKEEWISALEGRRNIYVCMDRDKAGEAGAAKLMQKLAEQLPNSSVFQITLPFDESTHADLTDYFVQKKGTANELFTKYAKHVCGAKPIDASKFKEMTIDDVAKVLDLTIKHDYACKVITFLAMLLTYTEDCQINVIFNASSSTGKTYVCNEVSNLFPLQDRKPYGKTTPSAFYYNENLTEKDKDGVPFIDLERRILIFSEQPNPQLLENLRAFLSHDSKRTPFLITNKGKGSKNTAVESYLLGFSTVLFCSANMRIDEQEQTRSLILSPESSEEKIRESIQMSIDKGSHKDKFVAWLNSNQDRKLLMDRVQYIKSLNVGSIDIDDSEYLHECFNNSLRAVTPAAQRKISQLMSLVKAIALLNAPFRLKNGKVIATKKDIDEAMKLWRILSKSADYGVPPQLLDIYKKFILPAYQTITQNGASKKGITFPEFAVYYFKKTGAYPNTDMYKKMYLPTLDGVGLLQYAKNEEDKREKLITPLVFFE